ncbi:MAG: sugar phosphate isomerase/epimerase family protein [Gemmiger sp.]
MGDCKLAISNIAWAKEEDEAVYTAMQQAGFTGLEVAPTRIFPEAPYDNLNSAALFGGYLRTRWGLCVPSLQSIWYGQKGSIFRLADLEGLLDYTAGAFRFAHALNCPSLVFGCPKNRMRPEGMSPDAADLFFLQAGTLAERYGVRLAIEANPPVYTNFLNGTAEAFALVKRLQSPGLAVNLDLSTMLAQGERLRDFARDLAWVSHVHISEPGLAPLQKRPEHRELALMLGAVGYRGYVSVEMGRTDLDTVRRTIDYIAEVFA